MAAPAAAHRLPLSITIISPTDDGKMGITHRLSSHDAIRILELDGNDEQPELSKLKAQAKIARYVSKHFLVSQTGKPKDLQPITLKIIGAELDDDRFYIYQEMPMPAAGQAWYLQSSILKDLGADWLSHVNYSFDNAVRTLTFSGKPRWQKLNR